MLVISRRPTESIQIDDRITIKVIKASRGHVKIGIHAPHDMRIVRAETVWISVEEEQKIEEIDLLFCADR